ncbi:MAG: 1-acyl-sn-glycerol-3-phosphate acyltransferase [Polyangiaceae bacterium]
MSKGQLTRTYEPNPLLRAVYSKFFDAIQVDEDWVRKVRENAARGTLIYIQRNLNPIDFFALDHLTKRYGLPQVRYTNDLGLGVLNPMGKGWLNALFPPTDVTPADELRDALENGGSANLFLKRPPGVLDVVAGASGGRGLKEGDELIGTLIQLQKEWDRPILLVPQVFVWSKGPDTRGMRPIDLLLGPREWPSPVRTIGQFLYNYRHVALRAGEPLDLQQFLKETGEVTEDVCIRRVTYAMLRRVERERRSVIGPAEKPPDRVRLEIARSPKLQHMIADLAGERPQERAVLTGQALSMLRELQATPEATAIKAMEVALDRVFRRIYAGIEYDRKEVERIRELSKEGTLILLPSHKSHIDYLILSYVFNEENLQLPLIAAGDNLGFFPLGPLLRRGGAFFIRRSFKGDRLYSTVVDAYIRRLIKDGFPIEVFLEGGRSRNGKLLPPKLGLLNMIVEAALTVQNRPAYFIPVSIGYERVVEAKSYERELQGGEKKREDASGLLRSTEVLRHRYGRINLEFGESLSLELIREELGFDTAEGALSPTQRRAVVRRLGNRVMDEINWVTAVTPGALTALSLLSHDRRGLPHEELVERCRRFLIVLREIGARVTPATATNTGSLRPDAIREAATMFIEAELIEAHVPNDPDAPTKERRKRPRPGSMNEPIYTVPDNKRITLDTSKNMILHFFVERGLIALAMRPEDGKPASRHVVRDRVQRLSRLFKFEFRFHADKTFDDIFDETLAAMLEAGEVALVRRDQLEPGPGRLDWTGQEWLANYARAFRNFLEGYRIAARGLLPLVKGALSEKDLVKKALAVGNRMFLAGEIDRKEAVSKPLIQNAYQALIDQGYLRKTGDKLELMESFRNQAAVRAIEGRIAGYLEGGFEE